tara:strand:- start:1098 stop:1409 length:312 start_codon:yes stop_codon:yes gene_type:complete
VPSDSLSQLRRFIITLNSFFEIKQVVMFKFTSPIGKAGLTAQQTDHYDNHCANSAVSADQNQMLLDNILLSSKVPSVGRESQTSQNQLLLLANTSLNGLKTRG